MAEGFAKSYGKDVLVAASAGVAPASIVQPETRATMFEKNITLDDHFPKGLEMVRNVRFDVIVNMSGMPLPEPFVAGARQWNITDPIGRSEGVYRQVRDQIENLVMALILELRSANGNQLQPR